jgi:hypothetical protein
METPALNDAERNLLLKLGLNLDKLFPKERKRKDAPPLVDMSKKSAKVVRNCVCCGVQTVTYADFVKRTDDTGFTLVTVDTPSHVVKVTHVADVFSCPRCQDEKLAGMFTKEELAKMVKNLREQIRRRVK